MLPVVVVIDDDTDILTYTTDLLRKHDIVTKTASTGTAGLALIDKIQPNLVLLDLHLPDVDGESICLEVKKKYPDVPLIMFTAKDSVGEKVKGLNSGADDYVVKPFSPEELVARIKARLRGAAQGEGESLQISDLILDPKRITVTRADKPIDLTAHEFKLLQYLMSNPGIVLTRDMILNHVWMYSPDIETRVVDVYMGYLRKKIEMKGKKKLLHSIRGFGYTIKEA